MKMNCKLSGAALAVFLTAVTLFSACMRLEPGADPFVVNAERVETVAVSTFDLVLGVDDANRVFFMEQAPKFHEFCEWLRAPQPIWGTNSAPRAIAMVVNLNDVKRAYKRGLQSSNTLNAAILALAEAYSTAAGWLPAITNMPGVKMPVK